MDSTNFCPECGTATTPLTETCNNCGAHLLGLGGIITTVVTSMIIIGVVAIIGGVFSLKRRRWGLALAGSICAFFSFFFIPVLLNVPLAIAAIVLVVMGKSEFQ